MIRVINVVISNAISIGIHKNIPVDTIFQYVVTGSNIEDHTSFLTQNMHAALRGSGRKGFESHRKGRPDNLPALLAAVRSREHADLPAFLRHLEERGRGGFELYLGGSPV